MSLCLPPGMASVRSRSSGSSTSSLSSAFSVITSSTSASTSSSNSKTNAFFASPFSTRSPSPEPAQPIVQPTHSLTVDFFSMPVESWSPPSSPSTSAKASRTSYFPSRIFPSRYTSGAARRSPELQSSETPPLLESDSSFTATLENTRLPTPPPPPPVSRNVHQQDPEPIELPTPRPSEHSLLLHSEPDHPEVEQLGPGCILSIPSSSGMPPSPTPPSVSFAFTIAPPSPCPASDRDAQSPTPKSSGKPSNSLRPSPSSQSLASYSPKTDQEPFDSALSMSTSALRLLKPLGNGTFSSVWLGEDLGIVPLAVLSKKCVRDLRRRASTKQKLRERKSIIQPDDTDRENEHPPIPIGKLDKRPEEPTKRAPGRLREGLRNIFSRSSASQPNVVAADPLSRNPSRPSHSPTSSISGDDLYAMSTLPSTLPSANSTTPILASPSSNLTLNLGMLQGGDGTATSLSRDASLRRFRERVSGTRPGCRFGRMYLDESDGAMGEPRRRGTLDEFGLSGKRGLDEGLSRRSSCKDKERETKERLVAVKVTPRSVTGLAKNMHTREEEERTRVRFVREVEVLKHISHPNITPLFAHLSTQNHHILVLPYLPGGDLLDLVNSEVAWGKLGESVLRRIWCELCKAVGWMHGVGLVHRDIKLENILLTTAAFTNLTLISPPPTIGSPELPPVPSALIKLTDFGLSRFVEMDESTGEAELLTTRCGSEAYAAPELVMGGRAGYDARKTDAWACGVVLYALVGRTLPFGEGVGAFEVERGRGIGTEKVEPTLAGRRRWLMKIARGEWVWPGDEKMNREMAAADGDERQLVGPTLVKSEGARRIVERLLVRDTRKRATIADLCGDSWMCVDEAPSVVVRTHDDQEEPPLSKRPSHQSMAPSPPSRPPAASSPPTFVRDFAFDPLHEPGETLDDQTNGGRDDEDPPVDGEEEEEFLDGEDEEEDEGGCLLDHEGIDSITRQEVV